MSFESPLRGTGPLKTLLLDCYDLDSDKYQPRPYSFLQSQEEDPKNQTVDCREPALTLTIASESAAVGGSGVIVRGAALLTRNEALIRS